MLPSCNRSQNRDENNKNKIDRANLKFRGTVKLHGTHGDIVYDHGEIYFQSRNTILTDKWDNQGMYEYLSKKMLVIQKFFQSIIFLKRSFYVTEIKPTVYKYFDFLKIQLDSDSNLMFILFVLNHNLFIKEFWKTENKALVRPYLIKPQVGYQKP